MFVEEEGTVSCASEVISEEGFIAEGEHPAASFADEFGRAASDDGVFAAGLYIIAVEEAVGGDDGPIGRDGSFGDLYMGVEPVVAPNDDWGVAGIYRVRIGIDGEV